MKKTVPITFDNRIIGTATVEETADGSQIVHTEITDPAVKKFLELDTGSIHPCPTEYLPNLKEKQDG